MFMQLNRYVAKHKNLIFWGLLIAIAIPFILVFGNTGDALRSGRLFTSENYGTMFGREVEYDDVRIQIFGIYINATRTGQPYSFAGGQFRQNPLYVQDVGSFKYLAGRLTGQERHKYTQMFGRQALQRMRILHEADVQGFADVSDEEVRKAIQKFPPFLEKGKFSRLKYDEFRLDVVESTFLTMVAFEQCIRDSIVVARFDARFRIGTTNELASRGSFVQSFTEADGRIQMFNPSYDPADKIVITDLEMKAAFDAQKNKGGRYYVLPSKSLYLVSFKADADDPKVTVSDKEIEEQYKKDLKTRYTADMVKVRHILLKVEEGADEKTWAAALTKIQGILKEARADKDFAELAKKHSDDPGSKNKGGLYDFFGRGRMVKPFDDAAFALKKDKISEPVKTRFGYHIIKKIDSRKTTPLTEVKVSVRRMVEREKIKAIWSELAKAEYDKEVALDKTRKPEEQKYTTKQHHLLHLLVRNKIDASEDDKKLNLVKAKNLLAEAKKTKNFRALAKKHSDGPAKKKGGDLDFVTAADLDGDLAPLAPALELKKGAVSAEVITSSVGYHIVKKIDEKIAPVPFEKLKEKLVADAESAADQEIAKHATKAAEEFSSKCFDNSREMDHADIQKLFQDYARKGGLQVIKSGYFNDGAYGIEGVPGSSRPVIEGAKMLTENQPLSGVIENQSYRFVVCLADKKEGNVPELKDVLGRVKMDLENSKRIEAAHKNAEIAKKRIKDELAKGVPFSKIKGAHKLIPIPPAPRSRDRRPNPAFQQARALARGMKAGELAVLNISYGAYLVYVAEQKLPPARIYPHFAKPQLRQIPQQMGYEMLAAALQELETKHEFKPTERWSVLFEDEKPAN